MQYRPDRSRWTGRSHTSPLSSTSQDPLRHLREFEASPNERNQGGSLDLHEDTGLKVLAETGLLEKAKAMMRGSESESMKIVDKDGKVWLDESQSAGPDNRTSRPEMDR